MSQRTYITREIVATDGGNRSSSVELSVTITNVKNQPPQWEKHSYSVVIPENTVRDTPIVVCWGGVYISIGIYTHISIRLENIFSASYLYDNFLKGRLVNKRTVALSYQLC